MTKKAMNMTLFPRIVAEIDARGAQRSVVVGRDLERLYGMYAAVLKKLDVTLAEACLLVDALRGVYGDPEIIRTSLDTAVRYDRTHKKWGADGEGLLIYLTGQSSFVMMTILDAVERYWASPAETDNGVRERVIKEKVAELFGIKERSAVANG